MRVSKIIRIFAPSKSPNWPTSSRSISWNLSANRPDRKSTIGQTSRRWPAMRGQAMLLRHGGRECRLIYSCVERITSSMSASEILPVGIRCEWWICREAPPAKQHFRPLYQDQGCPAHRAGHHLRTNPKSPFRKYLFHRDDGWPVCGVIKKTLLGACEIKK